LAPLAPLAIAAEGSIRTKKTITIK